MPLTMRTKSRGKKNIKYSAERAGGSGLKFRSSLRTNSLYHRENNNFPIIEIPFSHSHRCRAMAEIWIITKSHSSAKQNAKRKTKRFSFFSYFRARWNLLARYVRQHFAFFDIPARALFVWMIWIKHSLLNIFMAKKHRMAAAQKKGEIKRRVKYYLISVLLVLLLAPPSGAIKLNENFYFIVLWFFDKFKASCLQTPVYFRVISYEL